MEVSFNGKRALVTGAGQGVGKSVVKKLVSCGAEVVALSKTKANLDILKEEIPCVETICVDLADWDATKNAITKIGPVDLLVNNAAVADMKPFGEIDEETLDRLFAVNVKAIVNVSQIVVQGMKERGTGGSIVNVSSIASTCGLANHTAYGISKGGLDQLTRIMAVELGLHGIRVNSVNPTVINTEMAQVGWSNPEKVAAMKSNISLGRFCEPEEIANTIAFLLSDASPLIHGVCLLVDGGCTTSLMI